MWPRQTLTCTNHTVRGFCVNALTAMILSIEISWRSTNVNSMQRSQSHRSTLVNTLISSALYSLLALCVKKDHLWCIFLLNVFHLTCSLLIIAISHFWNTVSVDSFFFISQVKCKKCKKKMEQRHLLEHEVMNI